MKVSCVISNNNAWDALSGSLLVTELEDAFNSFDISKSDKKHSHIEEKWNNLLSRKGWLVDDIDLKTGPRKAEFYARTIDGTREFLLNWIYLYCRNAHEKRAGSVPILLVKMKDNQKTIPWGTFEKIHKECMNHSPIPSSGKFIILGLSANSLGFEPSVFELGTTASTLNHSGSISILNEQVVEDCGELFDAMLMVAGAFGRYIKSRTSSSDTDYSIKIEENSLSLSLTTTLNDYESVGSAIREFQLFFQGNRDLLIDASREIERLEDELTIVKALLQNAQRREDKLITRIEKTEDIVSKFFHACLEKFSLNHQLIVLDKKDKDDFLGLLKEIYDLIPESDNNDTKQIIGVYIYTLTTHISDLNHPKDFRIFLRSLLDFATSLYSTLSKGKKIVSEANSLIVGVEKLKRKIQKLLETDGN